MRWLSTFVLWPIPFLLTCGKSQPSWAGDVAPQTYRVGVAQIDITPDYPVRLHGFGSRRAESEGITQKIWAKALAIEDEAKNVAILITVDNLGVPDRITRAVARSLGLKPDRLAIAASHTHTAPMLTGVAPTIFGMPIPKEHQAHIDRYTAELIDKLDKVARTAVTNLQPARLSWGVGKVGFAKNRRPPPSPPPDAGEGRVAGGPVDHDLHLLVVRDLKGNIRAIHVTYACHCVTLRNNKISGDWAGYAQEMIQKEFPGALALVSIGCGADQNPKDIDKGNEVAFASRQGEEIAREVKRLLAGHLSPITGKLATQLERIELAMDALPTRDEWAALAKKKGAVGYHAQVNLARLDKGEKLKTKIDYPIQTWTFGDSLAMVFLPGEVVVDYSLRLKRELDSRRLWITAYANDAPCYIPSERVLKEGGYEGGGAMIYYDLPTKLKPGVEEKIIDAVHKQIGKRFKSPFDPKKTQGTRPLSPHQSLATLKTHPELVIELVAAEPLVADPVAIDFGPDGRLWVAEMADYPTGRDGKYQPGGRIRVLEDTDGDGRYDKATVFVDKIPFPTGVTVWRKGVLICAAPDILYAEDGDGDGKADLVRSLYYGFGTHNYQARVNSLHYGLDGWVYGACGGFGGKISSFANGKHYPLGDRDFRIKPDTGEIEAASGRTQQGRVRDDWGNWFGCSNSALCFHFPLAEHYLRRNPHLAVPATTVLVPQGPDANRLYPAKADLQLFKLSGPPGRTTAACGLGIYRDELLGKEYAGNAFVCEPANLLVHRLQLAPRGVTFVGRRSAAERESEFLTSTDTWFRPVQARTGPDGALWVVDMYRFVIEHPKFIPPNVLAQLDIRAGDTMGRIYRIYPASAKPQAARLDKLDTAGLVAALDSPNGTQRDLAGQMLLWRADKMAIAALQKLAVNSPRAPGRLHALCVLDGLGELKPELVMRALADPHPGVRRHAVRLSEKFLTSATVVEMLGRLSDDPDAQVRLQLAYTLGELSAQRSPRR